MGYLNDNTCIERINISLIMLLHDTLVCILFVCLFNNSYKHEPLLLFDELLQVYRYRYFGIY